MQHENEKLLRIGGGRFGRRRTSGAAQVRPIDIWSNVLAQHSGGAFALNGDAEGLANAFAS